MYLLVLISIFQLGMSSDFSYFGEHGTANWATLFEDYCSGSKQSPIDIDTSALVKKDFDPLVLTGYKRKVPGYWANNGHSAQFTLDDSGKQMVSGGPLNGNYALIQFHFHWGSDSSKGSEHTVDGEQYPLEMHMVHIKEDYLSNSTAALDDEEGYAVIALFFQVTDKKSRTLKKVSEFVQAVSEEEIDTEIEANLRVGKIASFKKINWNNYYHYMGGFTTPNCYEVANWVIMREPLQVSESFLESFRTLNDEGGDPLVDNFRPTQPLNGRTVFLNEA